MLKAGSFLLCCLIAVCSLAFSAPTASAFEPTEGIQRYKDNERLHFDLSLRYFITTNQRMQLQNVTSNFNPTTYEIDFRTQYRLFENPFLALGEKSFIPESLR